MSFVYRRLNFKDNTTGSNYNIYYDFTNRDANSTTCYYRSACLVYSVASALKDMGIGWDIDTSYGHVWADDPNHSEYKIIENNIEVPMMVYQSDKGCGVIMKNSESGCQLFIAYLCGSNGSGINLPANQVAKFGDYVSKDDPDKPSYAGLICSMIPGDSTQRFGSFSDNTFIPSHATRVSGMCVSRKTATGSFDSTKSSYLRATLVSTNVGKCFSYGILATPYCVLFGADHGDTENYPDHIILGTACGRIFGGLQNDESLPQAKYGVLYLSLPNGIEMSERGNGLMEDKYTSVTNKISFDDVQESTYGSLSFRNGLSTNGVRSLGNIFKADGTAVGYTSTSQIRVQPEPYLQLSSYVKDNDSNIMWCPFLVGVVSSNLASDGIVAGNGMKGYLDADLFRCARISELGRKFNNGKFYSVGYNLVIGWDPLNNNL